MLLLSRACVYVCVCVCVCPKRCVCVFVRVHPKCYVRFSCSFVCKFVNFLPLCTRPPMMRVPAQASRDWTHEDGVVVSNKNTKDGLLILPPSERLLKFAREVVADVKAFAELCIIEHARWYGL